MGAHIISIIATAAGGALLRCQGSSKVDTPFNPAGEVPVVGDDLGFNQIPAFHRLSCNIELHNANFRERAFVVIRPDP